jgi:hypothetical protein
MRAHALAHTLLVQTLQSHAAIPHTRPSMAPAAVHTDLMRVRTRPRPSAESCTACVCDAKPSLKGHSGAAAQAQRAGSARCHAGHSRARACWRWRIRCRLQCSGAFGATTALQAMARGALVRWWTSSSLRRTARQRRASPSRACSTPPAPYSRPPHLRRPLVEPMPSRTSCVRPLGNARGGYALTAGGRIRNVSGCFSIGWRWKTDVPSQAPPLKATDVSVAPRAGRGRPGGPQQTKTEAESAIRDLHGRCVAGA